MPDLDRAVSTIIRDCLGIKAGEDVLVVVDPATEDLGRTLLAAARDAGADAVLALMDERQTSGTEPPPPIAAALAATDAYLAPTTKSISHTQARKRASDLGVRGATMPGVTTELLARVMDVDLAALGARSRAVARLLDEAHEAHLTCPRGSDMRFDLHGRHGLADDGDLTARGAFGNMPCGEGFIAPAGGEGRIVASSIAMVGIADPPAVLDVREGRLETGDGGTQTRAFMHLLAPHGNDGRNLAELGIGTNDNATLTGNVLEDEKILGTVHVAFGASAAIGGTVSVPIHLDVVVLDATLDLDGTRVVDAGQFVLDAAPA